MNTLVQRYGFVDLHRMVMVLQGCGTPVILTILPEEKIMIARIIGQHDIGIHHHACHHHQRWISPPQALRDQAWP